MKAHKVLLLEFNEINWMVIDRLLELHGPQFLPNFVRLRQQGTWATPLAQEEPPHLDPWITWVTLHTGVSREVHGAAVLEQDGGTINARRVWDYAVEAGRSIGIFASIGAYPPKPVPGFVVPGPFAPSNQTFPISLEPVQALNRRYTHVHNKTGEDETWTDMLKQGASLFRLGLRPKTCAQIAMQLAQEKLQPHTKWRRVSLQPLVNFDFFSQQYRKHRPDFATWHTNHAAHYMHHYWRAWQDAQFLSPSPADEKQHYGEAVPYGYRLCDELLGRFVKLIDDDTVLVLASSMGQKPFVTERYKEGKIVVRFKDVRQFLNQVNAQGVSDIVPTMIPQVNVRVADAAQRATLRHSLGQVQRQVQGQWEPVLNLEETAEILTLTPRGLAQKEHNIQCRLPGGQLVPIEELFAIDAPTPKQGMHDPRGLAVFFGRGIAAGQQIASCTNLDMAPTMLTLMGIPVPEVMQGRVLREVFAAQSDRAAA